MKHAKREVEHRREVLFRSRSGKHPPGLTCELELLQRDGSLLPISHSGERHRLYFRRRPRRRSMVDSVFIHINTQAAGGSIGALCI